MKVKTITFSGQPMQYEAPEMYTIDIAAEGILCFSTEILEEDDYNPWGTTN